LSWSNVDLSKVSPVLELIPEGKYTFTLAPGAREDENGRLILTAHITNDGDFNGRRVTFSYPNLDQADWAPAMVKRLQEATGLDAVEGETPIQFFSRAAGATFGAPIVHQEYTPEGATQPRKTAKLNIFKTYAAA